MPTIKMKRIHLVGEISRVDEEQRIVEGYAFVNEVVPGEGGVRLTRAAMEAATADYVANGTVREMHQPMAAGKPLEVTWDDKGAYLRAKVVDDQAWNKVKEGVYRGFSVGVDPKVMRGKNVTTCEWADASLIDRGKDKDALFTLWRSDSEKADEIESDVEVIEDTPEDIEIERCETLHRAKWDTAARNALPLKNFGWPKERKYPIKDQDDVDSAAKLIGKAPEAMRDKIKKRIIGIAKRLGLKVPDAWATDSAERGSFDLTVMRGAFAKMAEGQMSWMIRSMAFDILSSAIWQIQDSIGTLDERETAVREAIEEFTDFIMPSVIGGTWPDPSIFADVDTDIDRSVSPTLTRFFDSEQESRSAINRANLAEALSVERLEQVSALTIERDGIKAELTRVQESERTAIEEVQRLNALPPRHVPVQNVERFNAPGRKFGYQLPDDDAAEVTRLQTRHSEILRGRADMSPKERETASLELIDIQRRVAQLGGRT